MLALIRWRGLCITHILDRRLPEKSTKTTMQPLILDMSPFYAGETASADSNEFCLLRYAVGGITLGDLDAVDLNPEIIAPLLDQHRMLYTFLRRLTQDIGTVSSSTSIVRFEPEMFPSECLPTFCSGTLIPNLLSLQHKQVDFALKQHDTLIWMASIIASDNRPIMVIKGPAVREVLNYSIAARPSSDVDLFVPNLNAFWQRMMASGASGHREEGHHEFAHFAWGDMKFELHRYFPMWSYPNVVERSTNNAQGNNCIAYDDNHVISYKMTYEELLASSTSASSLGKYVRVPEVELSAVLLMSHMLRNHIYSPLKSHLSIKFYELHELNQLLESNGFSFAKLEKYIIKYNSRDALAFSAWCLLNIYGSKTLRSLYDYLDYRASFPRRVVLDSFVQHGWYFPHKLNDFILHQDIRDVVYAVPHNRLCSHNGDKAVIVSGEERLHSGPVRDSIQSTDGKTDIGFDLSIRRMDHRMAIAVELQHYSSSYSYYIGLYFSREVRLWALLSEHSGSTQITGNMAPNSVSFDRIRSRFTCILTPECCLDLTQSKVDMMLIVKKLVPEVEFALQNSDATAVAMVVEKT